MPDPSIYPGPGPHPAWDAPMTLAEERLATVFKVNFALLAAVSLWFLAWLLCPEIAAAVTNFAPFRLGLPAYPAEGGRLFVALGLSLVFILMLMAWRVAQLPRFNRGLVPIFCWSKAVSASAAFLLFLIDDQRALYLGTTLADGLMGLISWRFWLTAVEQSSVPAWPQSRAQVADSLPRGPLDFDAVTRASGTAHELWMRTSEAPALADIAGWEWRGMNTPPWTFPFRKFVKGFRHIEGEGPSARYLGYNIDARQDRRTASSDAWDIKGDPSFPKRYGYYALEPVDPAGVDATYPRALLLDYGRSPYDAALSPTRLLRDYLVQPDPDNPDLLLGKAYLALGFFRLPVSYFVLVRWREPEDLAGGRELGGQGSGPDQV